MLLKTTVTRKMLFFLGTLAFFSACNTTKYLEADEFLLRKNKIKLQAQQKIDDKRELLYGLNSQYKQVPNRNFLFFFPREWYYFKTEGDSSAFSNWVRKSLGEVPALFDENLAQQTADAMKRFLQYKGFYQAEVFYDENIRGKKKIDVTYYVRPNEQFTVDSIFFQSEDAQVEQMLERIAQQSYLAPGAGLDGSLYEKEKARIREFMQNHGYAFFYPSYFAPLEADTTLQPSKANLYFEVLIPSNDSLHRKYQVGSVTVFSSYDPTTDESILLDTLIQGIHFRMPPGGFDVRPQAILRNIYMKPGKLYRQTDIEKTNRGLSALDAFRFVRIKESIDSLQPDRINFRVELTPSKRLELGVDFELNYTNRSNATGTGNLIGISVSPTMRHRNIFGGGELLATNLRAGVEVNPAPNAAFWNTIDLGIQTDLYFPKFIDYLGTWKGVNKLRLWLTRKKRARVLEPRPTLYENMQERASSRFSLSYNFIYLLDFYYYNLFNASFGYDVQLTPNKRFILNHIGADFLRPVTFPQFDTILAQNPFLERSFGNQLFVSFLFREFGIVRTTKPNPFGVSFYFSARFEISGLELWAANKITNAIRNTRDAFALREVEFSQFASTEFDFRYYKEISRKQQFVARAVIGMARPFGFTSDVPYVKQFFVGGPNSIRAWPARGLGPGGYEDPLTQNDANRLLFYQTGDLKLEFNLEYRFNMFWKLNGALFLDGGNVWTVEADPSRCGSQFLFSGREVSGCGTESETRFVNPFYKQIALGSGFGLRLDLSFFVLRLDLGLPIRNPFPRTGNPLNARAADYWIDPTRGVFLQNINYNIGLGYPF